MKTIRIFNCSAGVLLLGVATALFLSNWMSNILDLVPVREPVLNLPVPTLFWVVGGMALAMGLCCLVFDKQFLQMLWLAWVMTNFLVYRVGLHWSGGHGLGGYLGGFSHAFGVSPGAAGIMADAVLAYLVLGSYAAVVWCWMEARRTKDYLKMSCPACGVHIGFDHRNVGRKISCPQCQASVTLRKAENLKMSCFFCKEHIEFPAYAIGTKMACPHCKMDVTLKEPI